MKWRVCIFVFADVSAFFVSAWFPDWPVNWDDPNLPRRGRGYRMSRAGRLAFGSCGVLLALCVAVDEFQPKYFRYAEFAAFLVLCGLVIFFAIRAKAEFNRKNPQN